MKDTVINPVGVMLETLLIENHMNYSTFSRKSYIPLITVANIANGNIDLDKRLINKLSLTLHTSTEMWVKLQNQYNHNKEIVGKN